VSGAVGSIQWFFNGTPINGATGTAFTPSQIGNYSVTAVSNGCSSYSDDYLLTALQIEAIEAFTHLTVSPNPVNDVLRVSTAFTIVQSRLDCEIYDLSGKRVYAEVFTSVQPGAQLFIPMLNFGAGMYQLVLVSEKGRSVARIAVAH